MQSNIGKTDMSLLVIPVSTYDCQLFTVYRTKTLRCGASSVLAEWHRWEDNCGGAEAFDLATIVGVSGELGVRDRFAFGQMI
jgi:hypothetical protein